MVTPCAVRFSLVVVSVVSLLLWLKNNLLNPRSDLPGATLIGPKLLLTAAHCINAHSKVRVGAYDSHEDGYEVAITKKVPHPSYNRDKGRSHDVMLISIETTTPHPFIKLCREKVTDGRLTVIGFGSTASIGREISPTLLEVEVDYVDNTRCDDGHGGNGEIYEDMMCARKRDRDACKGDRYENCPNEESTNAMYWDSPLTHLLHCTVVAH